MSAWRLVYRGLVVPLLAGAGRVGSLFSPKLRAGLRGRRGLWDRLRAAEATLPPGDRRVWFHVTSVGEYEQARPVIDRLGKGRSAPGVIVTFFSPSGMRFAERNPAGDLREYLPLDTRPNARRLLAVLRPSLLVFVKFDLWPNLIWEAERAGVPVVLIDGTLSPGSRRLLPLVRRFYGSLYTSLHSILAISEEDARRFGESAGGDGARRASRAGEGSWVRVAGDTRYDQVLLRREAAGTRDLPAGLDRDPIWVVGSSWEGDERIVLPAFAALLEPHRGLTLLLAPHEPTGETLSRLEREATDLELRTVRLSALEPGGPADVILVDRVGILAELYRAGALAYVGGAFGRGLHNVMEPAALGLPLFFGPGWKNSHEAGLLLEAGAARVVRNARELALGVSCLLEDPDERQRRGQAGRRLIERHAGAARVCAETIETILTGAHGEFRGK
jgi:3-deoxy-D-manno-octulosonic-acid transferase